MYQRLDDFLRIDLSDIATRQQLHELLHVAFRFPDYYGGNWDAFDECIRDVTVPAKVELAGVPNLRGRLPRDAELLLACLNDFAAESSGRIQLIVAGVGTR